MAYYIGIMSGTSLDGVDVALVDIKQANDCTVIYASTFDFPAPLHQLLKQLISDGQCLLKEFGEIDVALGQFIGHAINELLSQYEIKHRDIVAIGNHGHTVYHSPEGDLPFSLQIGNANVIAEITQITTVADFRQRDVAASGQGAPLVPAFHQAVFSSPDRVIVIVNIGGIANVTLLSPGNAVIGFDTGPGNGLMDAWVQRHLEQAYDKDGHWAGKGKSNPALLTQMLADPYFSKAIPKSTGREYFNIDWVQLQLDQYGESIEHVDVQATLLSLSARTIMDTLSLYASNAQAVYVCGGGVHNRELMLSLQSQLNGIIISGTSVLGIDPDWVEAAAFGWLAYRTLHQKTGSLPSVTGAKHATILGGIYCA
ncbi:MAG: anhydro-N-acetylmuramic acid kinase [Methylophagaceae bacterium]|jgi:anhydro-N-acetylmuramic acid kinase